MIRHIDNEYVLYTSDGKRVLGRHPTRAAAQRQEAAIYANRANRGARKAIAAVAMAIERLASQLRDSLKLGRRKPSSCKR